MINGTIWQNHEWHAIPLPPIELCRIKIIIRIKKLLVLPIEYKPSDFQAEFIQLFW